MISIAPNKATYMDELTFPGTPYPEGYVSPVVPFPPVEAYAEDSEPLSDITLALNVVRESALDHLRDLISELKLIRLPASQEDVRRVAQVRTVVLGALETLRP